MEGHWSAQQPSMNFDGTSASATDRSHCILHQASEIQQQRVYEQEKIISAPLDYLSNIPGKGIRGKFVAAFNQIFQIPEERLSIIKHVIELLHLASLLIDDIEDSATLRRGFPVAHSIFGIAQTINSSNYVYFRAQSELLRLNRPEAFRIFTEELLCLHRGQGMDLHWRDSLTCPSEADYLEMVSNKTGGLFRLAIKLMQLESSVHIDCVPLVNILGIMFQIRDDYQNLQSYEYVENKGFAEDITEGKFSYPIIHSIHSTPGNLQLISVLRQRPKDKVIKEFAIQVIESTGSFEYCRKKVKALGKEASQMLETLRVSNTKGLYDILDLLLIS